MSRTHRDIHRTAELTAWPDCGVYQIWFRVACSITVRVGKLGRFRFPAGQYVYTGRAARSLKARVRRHIAGAGRKYWHIDYLLSRPECRISRVILASVDPTEECVANTAVGRTARCPAPGFGASDCRHRCGTHLWHIAAAPQG